ncbi:MAG: DUF4258 domain-containing protein [Candidatus Pacebacteria bacterium]|nr:DUF4258 domain-containing protein [Candidatus Paceibacterota bacterium]
MQTYYQGVIWTNHALQRLRERKISQSDAWYTFRRPDNSRKGKSAGSRCFYKTYGNQRIEVVAKKNEKAEWVILSCWSKIIGTGKPIFTQPQGLFGKIIKNLLNILMNKN